MLDKRSDSDHNGPMTKTDWTKRIEEGRQRLAAMKADMEAGADEVTAAHNHGFLTAHDIGLNRDGTIR